MNKKIPAALDLVAARLGNTRAVVKKYYVHPVIIDLYQGRKLKRYTDELDSIESGQDDDGYAPEEVILLRILKKSLI
jgi:DNA topoisomerase-1